MPKATIIFRQKDRYDDGHIREVVIWKLPEPTLERPHGYKYSLFYGRKGERIVGYDNERGKGDHRHIGPLETHYIFTSLSELLADFNRDVTIARKKKT